MGREILVIRFSADGIPVHSDVAKFIELSEALRRDDDRQFSMYRNTVEPANIVYHSDVYHEDYVALNETGLMDRYLSNIVSTGESSFYLTVWARYLGGEAVNVPQMISASGFERIYAVSIFKNVSLDFCETVSPSGERFRFHAIRDDGKGDCIRGVFPYFVSSLPESFDNLDCDSDRCWFLRDGIMMDGLLLVASRYTYEFFEMRGYEDVLKSMSSRQLLSIAESVRPKFLSEIFSSSAERLLLARAKGNHFEGGAIGLGL